MVDVSLEIWGENFELAYFPFGLSEQKGIHVKQNVYLVMLNQGNRNSLSQVLVYISIVETPPFLGIND